MDHFQRAIRLSPLDPEMGYFLSGLAFCCLIVGDDAQALTYARRGASQTGAFFSALRALAIALVQAGRIDEARDVVGRSTSA